MGDIKDHAGTGQIEQNSLKLSIESPPPSLVVVLPQYFIAFVALLYATGFLAIMAFFDRFGIRESGAVLWRARYIHIGILVLAVPVILNGTIYSLLYLMNHPRADLDQRQMRQRLWPILILIVNIELICMILYMVTRGGQAGTPVIGLLSAQWILGITLIGLPIVLALDRFAVGFVTRFVKENKKDESLLYIHKVNTSLRWLLVPIVFILDIQLVIDFSKHLMLTSIWLVAVYCVFGLIIGILLRTVTLYSKRPTDKGNILAYYAIFSCILLPLYYLLILTFAYAVFPLIPAARGGGDFTVSPHVVIHLRDDTEITPILGAILDSSDKSRTIPMILLQETSEGIYTADPNDAGGPYQWRMLKGEKPRLLFLTYDSIVGMEFESRSAVPEPAIAP